MTQTETRMPLGKYQGMPVGDVPSGYLEWVLRDTEKLDPRLRQRIEQELKERSSWTPPPPPPPPPPPSSGKQSNEAPRGGSTVGRDALRDKVDRCYRRVSGKCHPDRGGTDEVMQEVNA